MFNTLTPFNVLYMVYSLSVNKFLCPDDLNGIGVPISIIYFYERREYNRIMKRVAKLIIGVIILVSLLIIAQKTREVRREQTALDAQQEVLDSIVNKDTVSETKVTQEPVTREPVNFLIKQSVNHDVSFQPQAPFAVWDEVHEDTCEEASVVMAVYYKKGKSLDPQTMEDELLKLVDWQNQKFGYFKDTTAHETATMAQEYYGLKTRLIRDFSIDDLKKELSGGKLVLLPAAGQKLGNPFYKQPGPPYHMIVLRGYDSQFIYTNDPGTKRGENYKYYPQIILNAAADWPGSDEEILSDSPKSKVAIVIE